MNPSIYYVYRIIYYLIWYLIINCKFCASGTQLFCFILILSFFKKNIFNNKRSSPFLLPLLFCGLLVFVFKSRARARMATPSPSIHSLSHLFLSYILYLPSLLYIVSPILYIFPILRQDKYATLLLLYFVLYIYLPSLL